MVAKPVPKTPTVPVEYSALLATLGKTLADPALEALLARSGKIRVQKPRRDGQYVVCKQAGYTLLLEPVEGAPRGTPLQVSQIFLHYPGQDGARGFAFPHGLVFGQTQAEVRKLLGEPVNSGNPYADFWDLDGVTFCVSYWGREAGGPNTLCDVRITPKG